MGLWESLFGSDENQPQDFGHVEGKPMWATPKDVRVMDDELGRQVWKTPQGRSYTISAKPDQRTSNTKFKEDVVPAVQSFVADPQMPDMPTKQQVMTFGKETVKGLYKPFHDVARNQGTLGDVWETVGGSAAASAFNKVPQGSVRIMGGRSIISDDEIKTFENLKKNGVSYSEIFKETGISWDDYNQEFRKYIDGSEANWREGFEEGREGFLEHAKRFGFNDDPKDLDGKISDYLDHEELYKAYPEVKEMGLKFISSEDMNGAYWSYVDGVQTPVIHLNIHRNPEQMKSTLIHEIQHYVQDKEDLKNGTNTSVVMRKILEDDPQLKDIYVRLHAAKRTLEKQPRTDAVVEKLSVLNSKLHEFDKQAYSFYRNNRGELEARAAEKMLEAAQNKDRPVAASSGATDFISMVKAKANKDAEKKYGYMRHPEEYVKEVADPDSPIYGEDYLRPARPDNSLYGHMASEKYPDGIINYMLNLGK